MYKAMRKGTPVEIILVKFMALSLPKTATAKFLTLLCICISGLLAMLADSCTNR
jgi:hypothetical protein